VPVPNPVLDESGTVLLVSSLLGVIVMKFTTNTTPCALHF
jgi:hypothetical protein